MTTQDKFVYQEILIKLIELNVDREWDSAFYGLREGKSLPGGGAGSLNDWGPYYADFSEQAWYGSLYNIIRYLIGNRLGPIKYLDAPELKLSNEILLLKCKNCGLFRQHPKSFESTIAKLFFKSELAHFLNESTFSNLFQNKYTKESIKGGLIRSALTSQYEKLGISLVDLNVNNSIQICPTCHTVSDFDHVKYRVMEAPIFYIEEIK